MLYFEEKGDFTKGALFVVNKPLSWTSFDVVNKLKHSLLYELREKGIKRIKIGHAGTLDPLATGVVLVCVGKYTKRIEEFQSGEKEYVAELKLGATTPCYDKELPEDKQYPLDHITKNLIEEVLPRFVGKIAQIPPVYSALKVDGKRAYKFARAGKEKEMKARNIIISEIKNLGYDSPYLRLQVKCGKGTYIRALARDIGKELDSGAYLTALKRTRVGSFNIENALSIDDCLTEIKKYH